MTTRRQRLMAAVITSAAIPALVAGCTPAAGPARADQTAAIVAVIEAVPGVTGSLVNLSSAGVGAGAIRVKIYVDDVAGLSATVDQVLAAVWSASEATPDHISISAATGPKPPDAKMAELDGVDLSAVATDLGFDPARISSNVLLVDSVALTTRYGARGDG